MKCTKENTISFIRKLNVSDQKVLIGLIEKIQLGQIENCISNIKLIDIKNIDGRPHIDLQVLLSSFELSDKFIELKEDGSRRKENIRG